MQPSETFAHARRFDDLSLWPVLVTAERGAALLLLLILLPPLILVAALVAILSRRSPLVAHRRIAQHGAVLWTLKFRTMWGRPPQGPRARWIEYLSANPVPECKTCRDPRVTSRFAALMRKYSVDELPQLWHVARGDMSLVGPRPLTECELDKFYGAAKFEVLQVKPGLTGLWQICGRNRLNYRQRQRLDLRLVRNFSLPLYVAILLRTPVRVLTGRDAC